MVRRLKVSKHPLRLNVSSLRSFRLGPLAIHEQGAIHRMHCAADHGLSKLVVGEPDLEEHAQECLTSA
eukprot:2615320-Amphidinium_carterae.2